MNEYQIWFNRAGEPVDVNEWSRLHSDREYCRVAETTIDDLWVSTVWLGIDHGLGMPGQREIFETMIFHKSDRPLHPELDAMIEEPYRYATEPEAVAGHDSICVELRVLISNIEWVDKELSP